MKYLFSIYFLFVAHVLCAQNNYFYINLDVNQPLSGNSWIGNNSSAKGARIGYRAFINEGDRFSLGVDFNFTSYNRYHPTEVFQNPGGATSTDYYNYLYQYGLTVSGQYYFPVGNGEHFFPYVGLGVGGNHHEYTQYYNIYSDIDKKWGFLARPEAGIVIRFVKNRSIGALAALHYDYTTNKSEKFNVSSFSSVGFQIGLVFMNRY
ncbi:MAG TPA: hypothetical protein VIN08_01175 [Ohtaekwangia sp.]|uniref:hypothetical protein n=1 Tax=Ohtaekwangia sp. TaxID=2066019 RepID=UPI002F94288E